MVNVNREEAKKYLPLIEAYCKGKTIQCKGMNGWFDVLNPDFNSAPEAYRVKPEPKYVPYNADTFEKEGFVHNFVVRDTKSTIRLHIVAWNERGWISPLSQTTLGWDLLLSDYVWADDGLPTGVISDVNAE